MSLDLSALRDDLEAFAEALNREEYAARAGLKAESRAAAIRERFAHLAARDTFAEIQSRAASASDPEERRRLGYLAEFLGAAAIEYRVRARLDRLASAEAARTIVADGERLPLRSAEVRVKNESDRARRAVFERARCAAVAELNGLRREILEMSHDEAQRMGFADHTACCAALSGIDFVSLRDLLRPLLPRTQDAYRELLAWYLSRWADADPGRAHRHDLARVFRAAPLDASLPPNRLREAAEAPVRRMGLDPLAGGRIRVDDAPRPTKICRAFVATPRVPDEVILVVRPGGGPDDYAAYLHELGHALHFAYTDAALPVEYRRLGDTSVTEAYAFLFDGLLRERLWLRRFAGVSQPRDLLRFTALHKLWYLRRYAAKLEYELLLHAGASLRTAADVYRDLLTAATLAEWPRELYLADVDPFFYAARYLRAWIFEAQLRDLLRERFDEEWYRNDRTGPFLRELWRQGQRATLEALSETLGIGPPALEPLLAQIFADLQ
jgi:hypothetical protein